MNANYYNKYYKYKIKYIKKKGLNYPEGLQQIGSGPSRADRLSTSRENYNPQDWNPELIRICIPQETDGCIKSSHIHGSMNFKYDYNKTTDYTIGIPQTLGTCWLDSIIFITTYDPILRKFFGPIYSTVPGIQLSEDQDFLTMSDYLKPKIRKHMISQVNSVFNQKKHLRREPNLLACGGHMNMVKKYIKIGLNTNKHYNLVIDSREIRFTTDTYFSGAAIPPYISFDNFPAVRTFDSSRLNEKNSYYYKLKNSTKNTTMDYNFIYLKRKGRERYLSKILVEYNDKIYLMKLSCFSVELADPFAHAMAVVSKNDRLVPGNTDYFLYDDNNASDNVKIVKIGTNSTPIKLVYSTSSGGKLFIENSQVLIFNNYNVPYSDYSINLQMTNYYGMGMFYVIEKEITTTLTDIVDCIMPFNIIYKELPEEIESQIDGWELAKNKKQRKQLINIHFNLIYKLSKNSLINWRQRLIDINTKSLTSNTQFKHIFEYNIKLLLLVIKYYDTLQEPISMSVSVVSDKTLGIDNEYIIYLEDYLLSIAKVKYKLSNEEILSLKELL
uniref:Uncharacterized protein n=1 Tax=viral metagenome TaxID=1070528 RepID=A0A6C0J684_9ZZZZ